MNEEASASETGSVGARPSSRAFWVRRAVIIAFALACAWGVVRLVGRVDWDEVRDGLSHLALWQLLVLVVLVGVRQVLNASPLALFIGGLSLPRATAVDQGSALISMVGPPTSDSLFRIAVLRSWGIETPRVLAGSTMNVLAFYFARWLAPAVGFVLLLTSRFDSTYALVAAGCIVVAAAIFAVTILLTRTRALAEKTGQRAGSLAQRVRSSVEPRAWAQRAGDFQLHIAGRFRSAMVPAMAALAVKFFVDATVLLLAIRYVGLGSAAVPAIEVYAAFLVVFPLTLFPLQGIGIFDATIVAALVAVGGVHLEADLIASLLCYRIAALGTPALLGAVFLGVWRTRMVRT